MHVPTATIYRTSSDTGTNHYLCVYKGPKKKGGHNNSFFLKTPVSADQNDRVQFAARISRCGISLDAFEAGLYPPGYVSNKVSSM